MTFDEIYAQYHETALRHAEITCGFRDDTAEQIASDAFLQIHEAMQQGDLEIQHPSAFVCKQVRIAAGLYVRHECRSKRGGEIHRQPLRSSDLAVNHTGFDVVDARDSIQKAWEQLSDMERKIASMVFMENRNQSDVAAELNMPLRTVERNVQRLRQKLRVLLS